MVSFCNVVIAKTIRHKGSSSGYLMFHFFISFVVGCLAYPIFSSQSSFNLPITILGVIAGLLIILSMLLVGAALKEGPSGLSFAFLNAGSVAPPILLALIFRETFGFPLHLTHLMGMSFVLLGLFWASLRNKKIEISKKWIILAFSSFGFQALILFIFQWRCLLLQSNLPPHWLIFFHCPSKADIWFMPSLYLSAWLAQTIIFFTLKKRGPYLSEIAGGTIGGIFNGLSTFFLLRATAIAFPHEKLMLFPLFAALTILFSIILAKIFYRESIHWASSLCIVLGILIATLF